MNDSLGGYYRYETGTSMAAADVSGVLALMQDYFTNSSKPTPSPALLKAMLINGARRPWRYYDFQVDKRHQFRGLGLDQPAGLLPPGGQLNQPSGSTGFEFHSWIKARPMRWPPATATRSPSPFLTNAHACCHCT